MINLDDVVDMSVLTRAEIDALAEHEHWEKFSAMLMGEYLMHKHHGPHVVNEMLCEDIRAALHGGDVPHAKELFAVLRQFIADHPEAVRGTGSPSASGT